MDETEDELSAAYQHVLNIDAGDDAEFLMQEGGAFAALLDRARNDAIGALSALVSNQFTDLDEVRERQWEVSRYANLCQYIRSIIEDADSSRSMMDDDEADFVRAIYRGETEPKDA